MQEREGVVKFHQRFFEYPAVHHANIQELDYWRSVLYRYNLLGCDPHRYAGAGFGNVSKRCPPYNAPQSKRSFFITGTQTGKIPQLSEQHYTTVLEYYPQQNLVVAEGPIKPSSEAMTHGAIYDQNIYLRFVFHTHSPEIWRCARKLAIPTTKPAVEYGTPEMAEEIHRLFRENDATEKRIFVMGGHEDGVISFGRSAREAGEIMLHYLDLAVQQGPQIPSLSR